MNSIMRSLKSNPDPTLITRYRPDKFDLDKKLMLVLCLIFLL
jgi:hypothetical protein